MPKTAHISLVTYPETKDLIKSAARLSTSPTHPHGLSVNEWAITALVAAAREVITDARARQDAKRFER